MKITLHQAKKLIKKCLRSGIVPYMHSSPAIGKSSVYHQIAEEANLYVIDWRGSAADPTDLNGFPDLNGEFATYKPFDTFPTENTPIPKGYKGWLLLLDELSSTSNSVQKALYKLILDRMVGQHKLHPKVFMCAAGNLDSDNALVGSLSTALISRMAHLYITPDVDTFLKWAYKNNIDPSILSFLEWKKDNFYTFNPDNPKEPYASPRTWEMVDKIIKKNSNLTMEDTPLLAGLIGQGVAIEYLTYKDSIKELPSIDKILADPDFYEIPTRNDLLYCLTSMLGQEINKTNCDAICTYMKRLPKEFCLLTLKIAYNPKPELLEKDSYNELVDQYLEYV